MAKTQRDLSKKKTEKEKKIEKTEVTKPQRVYAFLTDPQSKLYALLKKRAILLRPKTGGGPVGRPKQTNTQRCKGK